MGLENIVRGFTDAHKGEYLLFRYEQEERRRGLSGLAVSEERDIQLKALETELFSKEDLGLISNTYDLFFMVEDKRKTWENDSLDIGYKIGTFLGRLTSPFNYFNAARNFANGVSLGMNYAVCESRIINEAKQRKPYDFQYGELVKELLTEEELQQYQRCRSWTFGMRASEALGFNVGVALARPHRLPDLRNSGKFFRYHPLVFPPTASPYLKLKETLHSHGVIERDISVIADEPDKCVGFDVPIIIKEYIKDDTIYQNVRILGNEKHTIHTQSPFGGEAVYSTGDNYFVKFPDDTVTQPGKEEFDNMVAELKI